MENDNSRKILLQRITKVVNIKLDCGTFGQILGMSWEIIKDREDIDFYDLYHEKKFKLLLPFILSILYKDPNLHPILCEVLSICEENVQNGSDLYRITQAFKKLSNENTIYMINGLMCDIYQERLNIYNKYCFRSMNSKQRAGIGIGILCMNKKEYATVFDEILYVIENAPPEDPIDDARMVDVDDVDDICSPISHYRRQLPKMIGEYIDLFEK